MDFSEEDQWPGRWAFAVGIVALCWMLSMLSILSWLIFPLLGFALFRACRRVAWLPMLLLVLANPMGVWFIGGLVDYAKGAPKLRYMGLPSMESYNIDPQTRCFSQTGGCVIHGNEWVSQVSHNLGVLALATLFGPPSRSYDGPYPSKEEAFQMAAASPKLDLSEFIKGRIPAGGRHIQMDSGMVEDLLTTLGIYSLMDYQFTGDAPGTFVQAAIIQDRCLIIRIVEIDSMPSTTRSEDQDHVIMMDMKIMRPFAYYRIKGDHATRRPRLQYLPEHSR